MNNSEDYLLFHVISLAAGIGCVILYQGTFWKVFFAICALGSLMGVLTTARRINALESQEKPPT